MRVASTVTHFWWHIHEQRPEDEWETRLRACVYHYVTTNLPTGMYEGGIVNDIRFLYATVVKFNRISDDEQIVNLHRQVYSFKKDGRPMKTWLDDLYALLDDCVLLRAPVPSATVRTIILDALRGDIRYK